MFAQESPEGNGQHLVVQVEKMYEYLVQAAKQGVEAHEVEQELWRQVRALGRNLVKLFLELQGTGDLGETVELPDGQVLRRLEGLRRRGYVTVFGRFEIARCVYGSREKQKIEFVPVDARLNLPESETSYMLQDWDQSLGVEQAWAKVAEVFERVLEVKQSVDTLERMNRQMAEHVESFRNSRPAPAPDQEAEVLVATVDNKGVPMRRPAEARPSGARRKKGEKANKKQHATIGGVYSVERNVRTPEELVGILFREAPRRVQRSDPAARSKRLWSCLTHERDGRTVRGQDEVFAWMARELARRRRPGQPLVRLMDGQRSLETDANAYLPSDENTVDILDLMHVIQRLWDAAYLFHPEGSPEAEQFVRPRLRKVLEGRAGAVVGSLRRMGTRRKLKGAKKKKLETICGFLNKNLHRMRYDAYLAAGYPIASGVIEGAARHVVKDRMERAGMRWSVPGALAMLDLRTTYINGQWTDFQNYRIETERKRLYPHQAALQQIPWPIAA